MKNSFRLFFIDSLDYTEKEMLTAQLAFAASSCAYSRTFSCCAASRAHASARLTAAASLGAKASMNATTLDMTPVIPIAKFFNSFKSTAAKANNEQIEPDMEERADGATHPRRR